MPKALHLQNILIVYQKKLNTMYNFYQGTKKWLSNINNKVFGFIFTILLTIAFVSLIVYATQPKKYKRQLNHNHSELTDYLLVKEN